MDSKAKKEKEINPPRKKRKTSEIEEQSVSELESLQQENERLKSNSAKQIRTLTTKIQTLKENIGNLEGTLEKTNKKNANLEKLQAKLLKQISALKAEKNKNKTKALHSSPVATSPKTPVASTGPKRKRGRPCMSIELNRDYHSILIQTFYYLQKHW